MTRNDNAYINQFMSGWNPAIPENKETLLINIAKFKIIQRFSKYVKSKIIAEIGINMLLDYCVRGLCNHGCPDTVAKYLTTIILNANNEGAARGCGNHYASRKSLKIFDKICSELLYELNSPNENEINDWGYMLRLY